MYKYIIMCTLDTANWGYITSGKGDTQTRARTCSFGCGLLYPSFLVGSVSTGVGRLARQGCQGQSFAVAATGTHVYLLRCRGRYLP